MLLLLIPTVSLGLRVSLPWPLEFYRSLLIFTLLSVFIKLSVFYLFRLYSRYWRYASVDELITITFSVIVATILNTGIFWVIQGFFLLNMKGFPRSIPFIDGLVTLFLVGGTRFSIRIVEYVQSHDPKYKSGKRVLIVGAGNAGELIVREMLSSHLVGLDPIGFVDDDPYKIGIVIHGVRVLGSIARIPQIIEEYNIQEVIIAIPTAPGGVIRNIVALCQSANVPSKMVPGIYEILNGRIGVERLRKVEIDDLLRRSPIQIDTSNVASMIAGKRVLITGAGGSIGSEICRQIFQYHPTEIILLGHGENSLFSLEMQVLRMQEKMASDFNVNFKVVVGDIRDMDRMNAIFCRFHPQLVFHAAAHKHVSLMEENPEEAVTNNILGTRNVIDLSIKYEVERFVFISTDKAVNPVSTMGMTKRVAEKIVSRAAHLSGRSFVSVRFGNVLGSRGSIVPVFQDQIAVGGPVTITHPEVTRFFMTIPEAVQLVLQAAAIGQAGDIYVLDMGEPVKIVDLVRDMIELSGYKEGIDIEIVYTGLRPGEKLFEELFTEIEKPKRTQHEKIFVTRSKDFHDTDSFDQDLEELFKLSQLGDIPRMQEKLNHLANEE